MNVALRFDRLLLTEIENLDYWLLKKTASLDSNDESLTMEKESGFFMGAIYKTLRFNQKGIIEKSRKRSPLDVDKGFTLRLWKVKISASAESPAFSG